MLVDLTRFLGLDMGASLIHHVLINACVGAAYGAEGRLCRGMPKVITLVNDSRRVAVGSSVVYRESVEAEAKTK